MHHVSLDRTGPYDRCLDHKIVEAARLHPRQKVHLGTAFHLEDTQTVPPCTACRRRRDPRAAVWRAYNRSGGVSGSDQTPCGYSSAFPAPATSTFRMPSASISSLSQQITVRSSIVAFSIGTSSSNRPSVMMNPPTCWDRCRGKTLDLEDQLQRLLQPPVIRVQPDFAQLLVGHSGRVEEPPQLGRDRTDRVFASAP